MCTIREHKEASLLLKMLRILLNSVSEKSQTLNKMINDHYVTSFIKSCKLFLFLNNKLRNVMFVCKALILSGLNRAILAT